MRGGPIVLVLLMVGAALMPARPRADAAQRESVQRHVYVTVTTPRGQPAQGLGPTDFVVREDDVAREVIRVSPAPPPSHLALLVDNTGEAADVISELRSSVQTFAFGMADLSSPPQVSLTTFADRPTTLVPFTTSGALLERGIQRIVPRTNGGAYLIDAVIEASDALRKAKAERPVIVAFVIDASPAFSNQVHTKAADALTAAGASLWTIELQESGAPQSLDARERAGLVNDVTRWSGGMNVPILSAQAIARAFAAVSSAMLGRYDVTYGRPDMLIPPSRVSVETRDRTLRVSSPRWPAQ